MNSPQIDYDKRARNCFEVMRLAEQTRVQHMAWAFEHLRAAEFWNGEHNHHARELHVTLIQKWDAEDQQGRGRQ
ncbi:MAG: hypothetical protein BWK73_50635 [Thiothrix lacustris]|uniref:Uncharacterized protein n=1 Tax=Thiothrix lacustris TaxID=525917 RepID=A0A1Y1Q8A9_9GAMM|nr:MAG: hypothetical protein BWK73_50635 [Thiothrix lacustris]